MNTKFIEALNMRRSRYDLTQKSTISDNDIENLLQEALKLTPTAFNSQAGRLVLLLNNNHKTVWDIVKNALRNIVAEDKFRVTEDKINGFQAAYGTVLFFEDMATIQNLQEKFPTYHDTFLTWSNEQAGMLQLSVWTALAENGMGASLQHYNPLIDEEVKKTFHLPKEWKLVAQMPFGVSSKEPDEKPKLPSNERLKVIK